MRLSLLLCLVGGAVLVSPHVGAGDGKAQWLPGMPIPQKEAAGPSQPQRVTSPEGNFAVTAPAGWTVAPAMPDAKEIVDRVRLERKVGAMGASFTLEVRPWRQGADEASLQKFCEGEITAYLEHFKGLSPGTIAPIRLAARGGWENRAAGKGAKDRDVVVMVAVAADGQRRVDALFEGDAQVVLEAVWKEILASMEMVTAVYAAQPVRDDLGEFTVTPPAGWLRYRPEGEAAPSREFRSMAFPSRDGSGGQFTVEVVPLPPAAVGKVTSAQVVNSYRANVIEKREGKEIKEVARGAASSPQGTKVVDFAAWTFTNAKGEPQYLMAGGVVAGGMIYSMMASGPADQWPSHRPILEASFGSFQLVSKP